MGESYTVAGVFSCSRNLRKMSQGKKSSSALPELPLQCLMVFLERVKWAQRWQSIFIPYTFPSSLHPSFSSPLLSHLHRKGPDHNFPHEILSCPSDPSTLTPNQPEVGYPFIASCRLTFEFPDSSFRFSDMRLPGSFSCYMNGSVLTS